MRYKKFVGENIYFSPIDSKDYELFTKWVNDETVSRGIGSAGLSFSEVVEKNYLEKQENDISKIQFSIIRKSDDKLLGTYGVVSIKPMHQIAEVGGFIGEQTERGKGYGSEALRMICDYCFNVLNLRNIYVNIYSFNIASQKAARKVGFALVGRIKEAYYYNNAFHDQMIFQINKDDFNAKWQTFVKHMN